MSSADGTIQVVFNGEIYNYLILREQLSQKGHVFKTNHSDTEVIVAGYAEWGTDVFSRLEGMFAIGIWDIAAQKLVLARDRLGIKPVYYTISAGGLAFASEPKAVLAGSSTSPAFAEGSVLDYFMFRGPVHPHSLFRGVMKLPPGTWCEFTSQGEFRSPRIYWRPISIPDEMFSSREAEERTLAELEQAVFSHTIADVPVGIFLSGGVDSSLIAALLGRHAKLDAFTVGTSSPMDESAFAQTVANHLDIKLHVLNVGASDFLGGFDEWMYFNDDPCSDPSALALMLLSHHARRQGVKVILAGEGADEIFGGYRSYSRYKQFAQLARLPGATWIGKYLGCHRAGQSSDYFSNLRPLPFWGTAHTLDSPMRNGLFDPDLVATFEKTLFQRFIEGAEGAPHARAAMLFDQKTRLPNDLLSRTDRATMASSLEARVPFLDRRVVELANSLPDKWCVKLFPRAEKWLLKRIAERKVPRSVVYREKRGFDLPLQTWLVKDFRERIESHLKTRRLPGINYAYLRQLQTSSINGNAAATAVVWQWLVLEEWHHRWILGAASPRLPRTEYNTVAHRLLTES